MQTTPRNIIMNLVAKKEVNNVPAAIIGSILAGSYFIPELKRFYTLSYVNEASSYGTGIYDLLFVSFYLCVWLTVRQFLMRNVPTHFIAKRSRTRFKEQFYAFVMYSFSFGFGMYCALNSKWYNNYSHFFIGYPHKYVDVTVKTYYLINLSLWIHMIFVLCIEKKRNDHYQMMGHHMVTVALISGSWFFNLSRIGNCIFVLFDAADILLALAKCLNYAKLKNACDAVFVSFVLVWAYTRHYVYFYVLYEAVHYLDYEPYKWNPSKGEFGSVYVHVVFVFLLVVLQVLALYWFWLIIKLLIRVVNGANANDTRSEDEAEEDEGFSEEEKNK